MHRLEESKAKFVIVNEAQRKKLKHLQNTFKYSTAADSILSITRSYKFGSGEERRQTRVFDRRDEMIMEVIK